MKKAVYIAIGVNLDGRKDVLRMWVGENESSKFWTTVLNGLENRCERIIFIACTDNLAGYDAAIHATFPQTEVQNRIIHQLCNFSKYVDLKALIADLKGGLCRHGRAVSPWMLWTPLGSAGTRNTRKSPSPGGPIGPISAPILSTPRRCAG